MAFIEYIQFDLNKLRVYLEANGFIQERLSTHAWTGRVTKACAVSVADNCTVTSGCTRLTFLLLSFLVCCVTRNVKDKVRKSFLPYSKPTGEFHHAPIKKERISLLNSNVN